MPHRSDARQGGTFSDHENGEGEDYWDLPPDDYPYDSEESVEDYAEGSYEDSDQKTDNNLRSKDFDEDLSERNELLRCNCHYTARHEHSLANFRLS